MDGNKDNLVDLAAYRERREAGPNALEAAVLADMKIDSLLHPAFSRVGTTDQIIANDPLDGRRQFPNKQLDELLIRFSIPEELPDDNASLAVQSLFAKARTSDELTVGQEMALGILEKLYWMSRGHGLFNRTGDDDRVVKIEVLINRIVSQPTPTDQPPYDPAG